MDALSSRVASSAIGLHKVYCPIASRGVCQGEVKGLVKDYAGRLRLSVMLDYFEETILVSESWLFPTFGEAMDCFIRTGGDKPE